MADDQAAMNNSDYAKISRLVSHALRHEPWIYELEIDEEGWTPVGDLLSALGDESDKWRGLVEGDLAEMIARSDKKRHELRDGKIRALYGHSLPGRLRKQVMTPPDILYHGTSPEAGAVILRDGLRPMGRQYVHLSVDTSMADQVGRRKARQSVILAVDARTASGQGVVFYLGNDQVWLADNVPTDFITQAS